MGIAEIRKLKGLAEFPKQSKRDEQAKYYKKLAAAFLKAHPLCACGCGRKSAEVHHMRGRVGKLLTDVTYFKAVSRTCHRRIENTPALAKLLGLSQSRLSK